DAYGLHPALLDAAFHTGLAFSDAGQTLSLPFAIERLVVHRPGVRAAVAHARSRQASSPEIVSIDVTLADAQGHVLAELSGLHSRPVDRSSWELDGPAAGSLYQLQWQPASATLAQRPLEGSWLVVCESTAKWADELVRSIAAEASSCRLVRPSELRPDLSADHVVCLWSAPGDDAAKEALDLTTAALSIIQTLARAPRPPTLWWVTEGAVAVDAAESAAIAPAALWGLGRTLIHEHPELECRLVDLQCDGGCEVLMRELVSDDDETQVAWRGEQRHVARVAAVKAMRPEPPRRELRTDGPVLITGGLGAVGLQVARWLVGRGVTQLILTGRRGADTPGAKEALAVLEGLGATVQVAATDVADFQQLQTLLASLTRQRPLRGVVHAAGVLDDGVLMEQDAARLARTLAPKVRAGVALDVLTRACDLDPFVLISSVAGSFGSPGQGPYSAANAALDALAVNRRARGLPAQSIAFSLWTDEAGQGLGLAAQAQATTPQARRLRNAIGSLSASEALNLLDAAVQRPEAHLLPLTLGMAELGGMFGDFVPPLWRTLVRAPRRQRRLGQLARELAAVPEEQRLETAVLRVREEIARVMAMPSADAVAAHQPLKELGIDSLMAVELRNALGRQTGAPLPVTLAFDYPTPSAIAGYLVENTLVSVATRAPALSAVKRSELREEPIAIVGMGCRYPGGVDDTDAFWELLERGVDAITEVPPERWDIDALYDPNPDAPGKTTTRSGGFLRGIDQFDPAFFNISSREAMSMDPQQRLLLETTWEALESAGIRPQSLAGSSAGVFVGMMYHEYGSLAGSDLEKLDGYVGMGNAASVASGRISYALGCEGPSMTVDTACSSSLVTVHLACQALRNGECSVALTGGVALMLTPTVFVEFSRLRALSSDGRCKSFSAAADGTGWSEGCGMLVLERLSDALSNNHRVLGLVRGSAVNQDGRSNGLSAPNGPSQAAVIQKALEAAGASPAAVQYIECHGTGTALGDPIEVQALAEALSPGRDPERPVAIGSIKSNIGHTQAAAGVAGIIKVVLALQHETIPRTLHFDQPSPHIAWDQLPVSVAAEPLAWPRGETPRLAGVSSFGVSGTNAHVVIEEAPPAPAAAPTPPRSAQLVVLSARAKAALRDTAARLCGDLQQHPDKSLADVAYSLATRRQHYEHRLALTAQTRDELVEALGALEQDRFRSSVSSAVAASSSPPVAFVFTGAGAQWPGMGRDLFDEEPVFRARLEECDRAIQAETGWSVIEALAAPAETSPLTRVEVLQPALFSLGVSLAALWRSWGIEPKTVVGHSQGEVAAAYVAGALTLQQAVAVVCRRSAIVRRLVGHGEMAVVKLSEAEVQEALQAHHGRLCVAGSNSARLTVVSGESAALVEFLEELDEHDVYYSLVQADFAGHSPQVDALRAELLEAFGTIESAEPRIAMISTVTGRLVEAGDLDAAYWADNLRLPVRLAEAVSELCERGHQALVEVGGHPVLLPALEDVCTDHAVQATIVGSLRRGSPDRKTMLQSLGRLHVSGCQVAWDGVFLEGGRAVELPTYPWMRDRYWTAVVAGAAGRGTGHPLLGVRVSGAVPVYECELSRAGQPWLYDHRVGTRALVPGAGLAELMRAAAEHHQEGEPAEVVSLVFQAPLWLPERGACRVQVVLSEAEPHAASIYSMSGADGGQWVLHAQAEVRRLDMARPALDAIDLQAIGARCASDVDVTEMYETLGGAGVTYGNAFRGLRSLSCGEDEVLGRVELPADLSEAEAYGVHPALLDAAFHSAFALPNKTGAGLPFAIDRFTVHEPGAAAAAVYLRRRRAPSQVGLRVDVMLADARGRVIAEVEGLRARPLDEQGLTAQAAPLSRELFAVQWREAPPTASQTEQTTATGHWVVRAEAGDPLAETLCQAISAAGATCVRQELGHEGEPPTADHVLCLWPQPDTTAVADEAVRMVTTGLHVVQQLIGQQTPPRLWWITRQAASVGQAPVEPAAAALWGLARTVMQEHPELGCTLVDVAADTDDVDGLLRELMLDSDEAQVVLRDGARHVARIVRAPAAFGPAADNYALESAEAGNLDHLRLVPLERREPGVGEVEVSARAWGLNFRDVIAALGVRVTAGWEGSLKEPLGGECAGVVTAVGPGVEHVAVGDKVLALVNFRRSTTVDARLVVRIPDGLSYDRAAGLPVVFLTAYLGLRDLAQLQSGERVLIHAAAGGVGMAAVQLAHQVGAEVYATASRPKWEVVRKLGVKHVASSRDLAFVEHFRAATGGEGVDVVLNSLSGEYVDASLSLLGEGGRFLEMGKTDIRDAQVVERVHPGVRYQAYDLQEAGEDRLGEMLRELVDGIAQGTLRPLPVRRYRVSQAEEAFRFMAQGRSVGKLVLLPSRAPQRDATALITGGLGLIGMQVARFLAERGVRHLVLTGRRGPATPGAQQAVAELEALGAEVTVAALDITDRDALGSLLEQVPADRPLRGVVHAAGILDDGVLSEQDARRATRVMAPKVVGAQLLDELTRVADLDFFVLFSSLAGTLGPAGQGPYAAANAFLDALALRRQAEGLPGLSLAWGLWSDGVSGSGGLAGSLNEQQRARLSRGGFGAVNAAEGMTLFEAAMRRDEPHLLAVPLRLRELRESLGEHVPPLWRALVRAPRRSTGRRAGGWLKELRAMSPAERATAVEQHVLQEVARVLSLPDESVQLGHSLKELGLDSLMAVELRNALGRDLGRVLPATLAFDHPTAAALAAYVLDSVVSATPPLSGASRASRASGTGEPSVPRETKADGDMVGATQDQPLVRRLREIQLDPSIEVPSSGEVVRPSGSLLLTGATGLLGAYLLHDLLEQSDAEVVCLVRAASERQALARIQRNLEVYGRWKPSLARRVIAVPGDLSKPRWGIPVARWQELGQKVDALVHNGAVVNHVLPYDHLCDANVQGTVEALRLACEARRKCMHFVSTVGVSAPTGAENAVLASLKNGYLQSKWVSERLLRQARERGLSVSIYRPGQIWGEGQTSSSDHNASDAQLNFIRACLLVRGFPSSADFRWETAPVEVVSETIVRLALDGESGEFDLHNPSQVAFSKATEWFRACGYTLEPLPAAQWTDRVRELAASADTRTRGMLEYSAQAIEPVGDPSRKADAKPGAGPQVDGPEARASVLECPPMDRATVERFVECFVRSGFFPRPHLVSRI
ncbi:MAG: thioester reductase domain-containing protein, partial [Myxococcales bacterium]|nr:thioester reductase domain-containing protein [Myxococcales bacterium]